MINLKEIKRGDIYYANFGNCIGSEHTGRKLCLIIQNDIGNFYSPTTIIAMISSKIKKNKIPTHVNLGKNFGLVKESICLCEQIRTIDKVRLGEYIGSCSSEMMDKINKAIKISLEV